LNHNAVRLMAYTSALQVECRSVGRFFYGYCLHGIRLLAKPDGEVAQHRPVALLGEEEEVLTGLLRREAEF